MENFLYNSGGLLSLVGIYLIILSNQKSKEIAHTIRRGNVKEGTVTEIRKNQGDVFASGDPNGYAPVVEFKTENGSYKHYSSTYTLPCKYHVGQKVKIYYYNYKSRNEFALEDDKPGSFPGKLMKAGIVLCIIAIPLLLMKIRGLY